MAMDSQSIASNHPPIAITWTIIFLIFDGEYSKCEILPAVHSGQAGLTVVRQVLKKVDIQSKTLYKYAR